MIMRFFAGLFLTATLGLVSCATTPPPVPAARMISYCGIPQWIAWQLKNTPVINVGQTITLVLPSDQLFLPRTANFNSHAAINLAAVACVLKYYNKVTVKIEGYTNDYASGEYNRALSQQQASKVANALWRHKVDTRLMTAEGMGGSNPIAVFDSPENRRIVIEFKYLS